MLDRTCPMCLTIILYKNIYNHNKAISKNSLCRKCSQIKDKTIDRNIKTRNCPSCNAELIYKNISDYIKSCKLNRKCKPCSHTGIKASDATRMKMSVELYKRKWNGQNHPRFGKRNLIPTSTVSADSIINNIPYWSRRCPTCNVEILYKRNYIRNYQRKLNKDCKVCSIKNRSSAEMRKKHRLGMIKYILLKNGGVRPMVNLKACKYIDSYSKIHGYNFIHALNGGEFYIKELGYWVDGYDIEKNVVFEYDEKHHFTATGELKSKDVTRMDEIKNHLKCKLIRYNEKINTITIY